MMLSQRCLMMAAGLVFTHIIAPSSLARGYSMQSKLWTSFKQGASHRHANDPSNLQGCGSNFQSTSKARKEEVSRVHAAKPSIFQQLKNLCSFACWIHKRKVQLPSSRATQGTQPVWNKQIAMMNLQTNFHGAEWCGCAQNLDTLQTNKLKWLFYAYQLSVQRSSRDPAR